jgi:hypothetical protein
MISFSQHFFQLFMNIMERRPIFLFVFPTFFHQLIARKTLKVVFERSETCRYIRRYKGRYVDINEAILRLALIRSFLISNFIAYIMWINFLLWNVMHSYRIPFVDRNKRFNKRKDAVLFFGP